ncbi:MAG TPA: hypothetical protein VGH83_08715 [Candidatus Acidoferrum sp.]|jgi:hypothetical protein
MNKDDQTNGDRLGDDNNSETPGSANSDPGSLPRTRRDKGNLHATRHGILSRYPLQALAKRGVNVRALRRTERALRAEIQSPGELAKIAFDRGWSAYLKGILAQLAEDDLMRSANGAAESGPRLVQRDVPTLVWGDETGQGAGFPTELLGQLAIVIRYDSHYAREFYRAVALLLSMKRKDDE